MMLVTFAVMLRCTCRSVNTVLVTFMVTCNKSARRIYTNPSQTSEFLKCYQTLGILPGSDQNEVRVAYLEHVKKYHPDSGTSFANDEKFKQIEAAYRKLMRKFASERWKTEDGAGEYGLYYKEKEEASEYDIKHTAPQHRQYLNYGGYGSGTPQEREKQYQKMRAATAVENVYKHRLSKLPPGEESSLLSRDKMHAKKNKISSEIHRLVEDLIQESMAKGDFENLPGSGKPLPPKGSNPYVDFATHKINEVLIESGFVPEWITLQKEITHMKQQLQDSLEEKRACLGPLPLTPEEVREWKCALEKFEPLVVKLNKKINDFNLQVPILNKQMIHFRLECEANKILREGKIRSANESIDRETDGQESAPESIFALIDKIFRH